MPQCIYCLLVKPIQEFEPEHVFTRAFCGAGTNWTLIQSVCTTCNTVFSKFEAHWARQTMEGFARNFHGPLTRNDKERFDRLQPLEIDHLYIVNKNDPLVYEAGFSYPNEHHYRPQIIESDQGLIAIAYDQKDGLSFNKETEKLAKAHFCFEITVPLKTKNRPSYVIATVGPCRKWGHLRVKCLRRARKANGIWLRSHPPSGLLSRKSLPSSKMTTRLALDHRSRLYLRSANLETAVTYMERLFKDDFAPEKPLVTVDPKDQHVVFELSLSLDRIFLAVIKNGLNLVCYLYGDRLASHSMFQDCRTMLLSDNPIARARVRKRCRFDDSSPIDFPKAGNTGQHRMMLDLTPNGILRYRLRLFDNFGYYAHLGVAPADWRATFTPKRVVVDYAAAGIHEVNAF